MAKGEKKRSNLIQCENCGEFYAPSYKTCPFCKEEGETHRATRGGGYADPGRTRRLIGAAASLCIIIVAAAIVVSVMKPLLFQDSSQLDNAIQQEEQTGGENDSTGSTGQVSDPAIEDEAIKEELEEQGVISNATGISLNLSDFTMSDPTLVVPVQATVTPQDYTGTVVWTSSDETVAYVTQQGVVVPLASGVATITATIGDYSASCIARSKTTANSDLIAQYVEPDRQSRGQLPDQTETPAVEPETPAQQPTETQPTEPSTPAVSVAAVTLNYSDITVHVGDTLTLKADGGDAYSWSSDDSCVSVDANGTITAVSTGKANITVTSGGASAVCIVRVKA